MIVIVDYGIGNLRLYQEHAAQDRRPGDDQLGPRRDKVGRQA